jgi:branched-chain amino acid transport system permease protein
MATTQRQAGPAATRDPQHQDAAASAARRTGSGRSQNGSQGRGWIWSLLIGLLILGAIGTVPLQNDTLALLNWTLVVMFCALAQAWNLIGGFAGYAAFGNVVFFGIGAYAVPLALQHHLPFWAGMLLGAAGAGLFAFLLGLPVLRLKGHYFAIATLGVAVALGLLASAEAIGGAADSIPVPPPTFGGLDTNTVLFYAFLALSLVLLLGTTWLTRTRFGYALVALRENEQAAEALGIPTFWYKVAAFTLSAMPTALAGSLYAISQGSISPLDAGGVFDPGFSVAMVLMTFLGGAGTILGPLIGGVIVQYLQNYTFLNFNAIYGPLLGVLIILVTIFLPQGLIRLVQEIFRTPVAADGVEAVRVSYIRRIGEGVRRVVRFIASQGI